MCLIDTLRRAAFEVVVAGVGVTSATDPIKMSRGVRMLADCTIEAAQACAEEQPFHIILLPGGMPGAEALGGSAPLIDMLRDQKKAGRWYGAICAAPAVALLPHGLLPQGAPVTCHPGFLDKLPEASRSEERVVVDTEHRIITSRGPGTAIEMALAVIRLLDSAGAADRVAGPMLVARV